MTTRWCDDCEALHPEGECERIQRQRAERIPTCGEQLALTGDELLAEHTGIPSQERNPR